jgi:MFS family permease
LSSQEAFLAWVWRIPFAISIVLVGVGLWIRRGVEETPMFKELEQSRAQAKSPIGEMLRLYWRKLLIACGVRIGTDVVYSLALVFTLTYVTTVLHASRTLALTAIMIGTVFNALTMPLFGSLSDIVGRRPVYAAGALLGVPWAFWYFSLMDTAQPIWILLAVILGSIIHAAMYGPQASFIVEQFPTRVRYVGASVAYNLSGIAGAGIAPLVFVSLLHAYGMTTAISLYVVASLAVTVGCLLAASETGKSALEE